MRLALLAPLPLAAALATPLVGCGGDDGDSTITDPGTWLETYVAKLCTKVHACKADFPTGNGTFESHWGTDVTACKATFLTAAQVRASVTSGKARFNAQAGHDCLAMLPYDTQACPDFWNTRDPAVCATVFAGTVAANGACANGLECVSGLACTSGTCTVPTAVAGGASPGESGLHAALAGR